ncbi:MAG: quinol:cytochrome C oxidoreductase [Planctomycetales bacterium]|nr:quinol:cytochrome C oxidoreductase [Planctomycetales bacterium]
MSEHAAPAVKPADDPAFQLPASLAGLQLPMLGGGLAMLLIGMGLANAVPAEYEMPRFGMSAYLTAFLYVLTIVLGCLFFVLIQHLVRAGWSVVVRRVAEFMMFMIFPMAFLFLPILFAVFREGSLFVWTDPNFATDLHLDQKMWATKLIFLSPGFFVVRAAIYFAIWIGLAVYYWRGSVNQDETGERAATDRMQFWSGPATMAFSLSLSFAAFDWGMSLAPMWFSTMFGVYMFAGGILAAHCVITLLTYVLQRSGAMRDEVTPEHYHDLGKYMFGFIVFWTYIGFSQYMLIWYGNIPEETEWFFTRQEGGFGLISLSLIFFHWLIPFFGTMSRRFRRRPGLMAFWAAYILILHFIDIYWLVMPEARAITSHGHTIPSFGGAIGIAASLLCVIGMSTLVLGLVLRVAGGNRLVPVRDPRLRESIIFENI